MFVFLPDEVIFIVTLFAIVSKNNLRTRMLYSYSGDLSLFLPDICGTSTLESP